MYSYNIAKNADEKAFNQTCMKLMPYMLIRI